MSFEARYPSRCGNCDEGIAVGDQIQYGDDYGHRGNLVHVRCDEQPDPLTPSRNERRCPDCWTWHAGECA